METPAVVIKTQALPGARLPYTPPCLLAEFELESRAGSPYGMDPVSPFDLP